VIQQKKDERQSDRIFTGASIAESVPTRSQAKEAFVEPSELTLLLEFFDLLAEWNESQEGETKG
jgi:hypothetical protein